MCFICGKNDGVNGDELVCDECHIDYKKLNDFLPKELKIYRYDKLTRNRYK